MPTYASASIVLYVHTMSRLLIDLVVPAHVHQIYRL